MRDETYLYRDYQIDVFRFGPGWRAWIYAPGAVLPLSEQPTNRWTNGKDQAVTQAMRIVDRYRRNA